MRKMRVTKYDPMYRNQNGYFYDIGKVFEDNQFNISQYIEVENSYINAILATMESNNVQELRVVGLEKKFELNDFNEEITKYKDYYSDEIIKIFMQIKEGDILKSRDIAMICRLILREHIWCKLENMPDMYVHFGYDYYMYVGCVSECEDTIALIEKMGLYVEEFESPYL